MMWTPEAARTARRIAAAAAVGGGGLTALGAAGYGLLFAEAILARYIVGRPHGMDGPPSDGVYGAPGSEPIRLAMLGDSTSVGLGTVEPAETPGVMIARGLAAVAERPVLLTVFGKSGAASADLDEQVDEALSSAPEIAVIFIGANDVTTRTTPAHAVKHLREAVRRLREAGAEVVVGTCPDLGTVRPIAQPLRWMTRRWSRRLAATQTVAVVEEGGRTVAFADLLGEEFAANPHRMFGPDRYHPSAEGYLQVAYAVLPSVCAALGLWPEPQPESGASIHLTAALAVEEPGAEVSASHAPGRAPGAPGWWVTVFHRRPEAMPQEA